MSAVTETDPRHAAGDLVRLTDLRVEFRGQLRPAVDGVSLSVAPGECVALVGESGSGKSVTARALMGLVGTRARVNARELTVAGTDATGFGERQWRAVRGRQIAMVFQDALVALDPLRTVGAEITEAARLHGTVGPRGPVARVVELLTDAGVPEPEARRAQYPHQLSGGLRQRALIASALAGNPSLLLADEPTTALDAIVQAQILRLLGGLTRSGRGLLLISHDLAAVAQLADRILVMREGRIVEGGPARQVLTDPQHPYTRMLLDSVPAASEPGRPAPVEDGRTRPRPHPGNASTPGRAVAGPVLEARDLVKSYGRDGRRALGGVSFTLRAGEALGVVGESGSGKTTLARAALGLTHPDAGEVRLNGGPWSALPERDRRPHRSSVQFVQQDPYASVDPRLTVGRVIGEALPGLRRRARAERGAELLRQVGLPADLLSRRPHQLSGGQRQRVAIARAIATHPSVLVCDEPVSSLDASVQAQVLELLNRLRHERGIALLFITHDLSVVRAVTDRVLIMRRGVVVEEGETRQVLASPSHPYTRELVASIPRLPVRTPAPGAAEHGTGKPPPTGRCSAYRTL